MRISTQQLQQSGINAILDQQVQVNRTQMQISTGKKILSAADDPVASGRITGLEQSISMLEQYRENGVQAENRLRYSESRIAQATEVLNRVRELALQGRNDTQTAETRRSIATELAHLQSELLDVANSRDANGEYLFAGYMTRTQPFAADATGGVVYQGDAGSRAVSVGDDRQVVISESGEEIFMRIDNGNGTFVSRPAITNAGTGMISTGTLTNSSAYVPAQYRIQFTSANTYDVINDTDATTVASGQIYTDGAAIVVAGMSVSIAGTPASGDSFILEPSTPQDVFATVQGLIDSFSASGTTTTEKTVFQNGLNRLLEELDQSQQHMTQSQIRIGTRLQTVSMQDDLNQTRILQTQEALSAIQDLDYASAVSELNTRMSVLEAAQQAYVRVQDLTLFNYIR